MAMGLPVVSFDTPVAREYLGDDGVYAPLADVDAFAAAITNLLTSETQRMATARALRQRAEQEYSWQKMGERIVGVYSTLCGT
jgi:glycosyltransferase involved in cell wall biosynthesis